MLTELQQQKLDIEREKNHLKAKELDIKENTERTKLALTNKEMNLQNQLKVEEIADRRKAANNDPIVIKDKQPLPVLSNISSSNSNISTGLVKNFD